MVYSHRKDSYNGIYTDNFTGTDMPGSYRSIQYSTFVGGISPMTPPPFSEGEHGIPNTAFVMDNSNKGAVHGTVSDANGLLSGAEVRVAGTQLYTLTDENGCFSFSSLNPGFCSLQISKYGYNTTYHYFGVMTRTAPTPPPAPITIMTTTWAGPPSTPCRKAYAAPL